MRRRIVTCLLAVLMLASLAVPSLAAGVGDPAVQLAYSGKCTVTFADKNKGTLEVRVTTPETGAQYLVVVQNTESTVPIGMKDDQEVMAYINQNKDGQFDKAFLDDIDHPYVYPAYDKYPSKDGNYYLYIVSDNDPDFSQFKLVAKFQFAPEPTRKLGDIDGDGGIKPNDALSALKISGDVKKTDGTAFTSEEKWAADVDGNPGVKPSDALLILKRAGDIITVFPGEK